MKKLSTCLIGALLAAGFASTAAAGIYRWVGNDGLVHYGDRPPPGTKAELIQPDQGNFGAPATPAPTENAETDGGENRTVAEGFAADDPERTTRIRREQCAKARERLDNYSNAARMQVRGEDGETREMSAEERVQAIARAEADVAQLCD